MKLSKQATMENTQTFWNNLIKQAKGRRYKGFPCYVSLRNNNEEWNGYDFPVKDLPLNYDNEDMLFIHIYERKPDGQLIDCIRINITAEKDIKELRQEMKKPDPDGDKIFQLLCGNKYNKPI